MLPFTKNILSFCCFYSTLFKISSSLTVSAHCHFRIGTLHESLRLKIWYWISFFMCTAWKVSVFGVFLVRIFPHLDCIWTRKSPNTETFHAVMVTEIFVEFTKYPISAKQTLCDTCYFMRHQVIFFKKRFIFEKSSIIISQLIHFNLDGSGKERVFWKNYKNLLELKWKSVNFWRYFKTFFN